MVILKGLHCTKIVHHVLRSGKSGSKFASEGAGGCSKKKKKSGSASAPLRVDKAPTVVGVNGRIRNALLLKRIIRWASRAIKDEFRWPGYGIVCRGYRAAIAPG